MACDAFMVSICPLLYFLNLDAAAIFCLVGGVRLRVVHMFCFMLLMKYGFTVGYKFVWFHLLDIIDVSAGMEVSGLVGC